MKNEIVMPEHLPEAKEEDIKIATKRREKYSLLRDQQAKEFNDAIASRLAKDILKKD